MIFEVTNPADPITVEASSPLVAAVAILVLGQGRLGLADERGNVVLPCLRAGGGDRWLSRTGIRDFNEWVDEHRPELARVLATATVGTKYERLELLADGADDRELERWNATNRTDGDLCGRARKLAAELDDFGVAA